MGLVGEGGSWEASVLYIMLCAGDPVQIISCEIDCAKWNRIHIGRYSGEKMPDNVPSSGVIEAMTE